MEHTESQQYRDELAEEIMKTPKEARKDILEKAKEKSEYWDAKTKKMKERQNEEEIDDGLGILVEKKTIYHGSGINGIKEFNKAEEDTVGSGVYFTSEAEDAIGYARIRSERERYKHRADEKPIDKDFQPIIYESSIENMKLCDLRKDENVKKILEGFRKILIEERKKPNLQWYWQSALIKVTEIINNGKVGSDNLKEVSQRTGELFSNYIKSLGYEGLITFEGGEQGNGNHDTYLIFDPERVKIIQEHNINID